jgi:glycosyltransferase involved in cell wall biosynthesis
LCFRGDLIINAPNKPLISIITIVFNGELFLERTINSVIDQNYCNVEYIVIDGGSTDKTLDILEKYDAKIDCWVSEPDKGISDAFNKGIKLATGEIIGLINADDYYSDGALSNVAQAFAENDIDYLYGNINLHKLSGEKLRVVRPRYNSKFPYGGMPVPHPSLFIRKKVYDQIGLYNLNYKIAMDYELFIRIHEQQYKSLYLDFEIAHFSLGGISDSHIGASHKENLKVALNSKQGGKTRAYLEFIYRYIRTLLKRVVYKIGFNNGYI